MQGIIVLIWFLFCGIALFWNMLRGTHGFIRVWFGSAVGMLMAMWLPSLAAFAMGFTLTAQYTALLFASVLALVGFIVGGKIKPLLLKRPAPPIKTILLLVLPFFCVTLYLLYTHVLRDVDGALHVGQSTYGDLCLHLGIATGLKDASFPPEYTILPGTTLGYPFLADALSATMLLFGSSLQIAMILPQALQSLIVYVGFALFAWEVTENRRAVIMAFFLLVLNGGLGFIYILNGQVSLQEVFQGYYQTPTNMPDLNLRWVNILCDLFIPQRTLLAGWAIGIPLLWQLAKALKDGLRRQFVLLGILAGFLPMVHTHTFLALGLISIGVMILYILRSSDKKRTFGNFLCYGAIAVAIALPQLLRWTFPQTINGGSLRILFDWVNASEDGLIDPYFWFWIKNVGPVYLLFIPAAIFADRRGKAICLGALVTYAVAECVVFQPNVYDNNKLFTFAFVAALPFAANFLDRALQKIRLPFLRRSILCLFMAVSLLSGSLTLIRECVSDYELFDKSEAEAAEWIQDNTEQDAVFLTAQEHNNPVSSLAGRKIVCGTGSYLYYHGVDYLQPQNDVRKMFEDPADNIQLFAEYGVKYIYISPYETTEFAIDQDWLSEHTETVFENARVKILSLQSLS